MSNELSNFGGSNESSSTQSRTNIEFENPAHPEQSVAYTSEGDAADYFEAATDAKDWPANRKVLVGEFLTAVQSYHETDSTEDLVEVMELLTGANVELSDE